MARWSREDTALQSRDIITSDTRLEGRASAEPVLESTVCSSGVHRWTIRVESDNRCYIGVVRDRCHSEHMEYDKDSWSFRIRDRMTKAADIKGSRTGPEQFLVPAEVQVQLDCEKGALSATVGDLELGVLFDNLPRGERLRFAVAPNNSACVIELLDYQVLDRIVLTCRAQATDGMNDLHVSCTDMGGEELLKIPAPEDIGRLRAAVADQLGCPICRLVLMGLDAQPLSDDDPLNVIIEQTSQNETNRPSD